MSTTLTLAQVHGLILPPRPTDPNDHTKIYEYIKELKSFVSQLEESNYSFLILYRTDKKWWQLIGHSVLYYHYEYAKRINRNVPNIRYDHDFYSRSATGISSVNDIADVVKKFKALGCPAELKKKDLVIIHLDKTFTADEVDTFAQIEDNKANEIHKLLQPQVVCPDYLNRCKDLHIAIADNIRKSKSPFRDKYGSKGFDLSWRLLQGCISMSNGQINRTEYFQGAKKTIELLRSWLSAMHAVRIDTFTNDATLRIAQLLHSLQDQTEQEIRHKYRKKPKPQQPKPQPSTQPTLWQEPQNDR